MCHSMLCPGQLLTVLYCSHHENAVSMAGSRDPEPNHSWQLTAYPLQGILHQLGRQYQAVQGSSPDLIPRADAHNSNPVNPETVLGNHIQTGSSRPGLHSEGQLTERPAHFIMPTVEFTVRLDGKPEGCVKVAMKDEQSLKDARGMLPGSISLLLGAACPLLV